MTPAQKSVAKMEARIRAENTLAGIDIGPGMVTSVAWLRWAKCQSKEHVAGFVLYVADRISSPNTEANALLCEAWRRLNK